MTRLYLSSNDLGLRRGPGLRAGRVKRLPDDPALRSLYVQRERGRRLPACIRRKRRKSTGCSRLLPAPHHLSPRGASRTCRPFLAVALTLSVPQPTPPGVRRGLPGYIWIPSTPRHLYHAATDGRASGSMVGRRLVRISAGAPGRDAEPGGGWHQIHAALYSSFIPSLSVRCAGRLGAA